MVVSRGGRPKRRRSVRRTVGKLLAGVGRPRSSRTLRWLMPRRRLGSTASGGAFDAAVPSRRRFPIPWRRSGRRQIASSTTTYARRGETEVRLATRRHEIRASQALRYEVFYREMSAKASTRARLLRRDGDQYDRVCDHMLVIDHGSGNPGIPLGRGSGGRVVATYRLLPQQIATRSGGFYSQDEYDLNALVNRYRDRNFLELGRSCVLKPYRNKLTIELLWQGVWGYIRENGFDAMVGCASLEGTDPDDLALPLSFLHHNALAPEEWRVRAQPDRYVSMNRMPADEINLRAAMKSLPPLIKGYLRLGAFVGDGAVIDPQFNTTDVFIVLPLERINTRYFSHFGAPDGPVGA